MKLTKNIVLLLVLIVLLSIATAKAQSIDPRAISTAGKIFTAGGFSMSTTFGEMTMVKTFSSGLYSLTQGFQQPNLLMSGVDRFIELPVLISLFPNPVTQTATLQLTSPQIAKRKISVKNALGQEVQQIEDGIIVQGVNSYSIDASRFCAGIYFVIITDEEQHQQTVKFIKE